MGYSKVKAATYVQPDLKDGDWSVDELSARNADQQETANTANRGTWPKQNSLTASEIATLDGKGGKSEKRNAIGAPVTLMSKQPSGYKSSVSKPDSDGASKPVNG